MNIQKKTFILLFLSIFLINISPAFSDTIEGVVSENFDEVDRAVLVGEASEQDIYRGGVPSREDLEKLADHGVRTILDFRTEGIEAERKQAEALGMRYISIPWEPDWHVSFFYNYQDVASKFLEVMQDPTNRPIYIHCQHGRDRTGTMMAIYRMTQNNWTLKQALNEMSQYGFNRIRYFNLVQFLSGYYKQIST